MTTDDDNNERESSSGQPLDPKDYHRRLVSAILDIGVENASPLQIYERMTLPKDRSNPSFHNLQLGQIKSHLQRFRMVYKNGAQFNNEKVDFLDDYDNFVDFGLDAAAARNDETNSRVMGGRIIGLVSRMIMVQDGHGVYGRDSGIQKKPSIQGEKLSGIPSLAARKNLDMSIPKLSPKEEDSPLGQSIKLVAGLLEHLNNHIKSERQRATQGYNLEDQSTRALSIGDNDQPVLANHIQIALSNQLPAQGRQLKLPLLPPQQLLIHPDMAEQLKIQQQRQQQQQHRQEQQRQEQLQTLHRNYTSAAGQIPKPPLQQHPPQPHLPQQQPQQQPQQLRGRPRLNSLSDVSSIGGDNDQSLITEEDLNFALLMPKSKTESSIYKQPQLPLGNQRLGKFIPLKETNIAINVDNSIEIHGRVYPPRPNDQPQQAYWEQGPQNQNPPAQVPNTIGSFEIPSPVVPLKTMVHLASQAFTVPTPAAQLAPQNPTIEPSKLSAVPKVTLTKSLLARSLPGEGVKSQQHPKRQQHKKTRRSKLRELSRLPASKLIKYAPTQWRERYKHSSKKSMFKKLHKAISEIGRQRGNDTRNNKPHVGSNGRKMSDNMSITGKTTSYAASDDHSSVASSLSSSSDSSLESGKFSDDNRRMPITGTIRGPQIQGAQVSVNGTTSMNLDNKKDDWMFDRFQIPRNVHLVLHSKGQPLQEDFEGEEDDSSWCTKRSTSLEEDCGWGIVKGEPKRLRS